MASRAYVAAINRDAQKQLLVLCSEQTFGIELEFGVPDVPSSEGKKFYEKSHNFPKEMRGTVENFRDSRSPSYLHSST